MKFLKIRNIGNGVIDYKGLDINQFLPGFQVYPSGVDYCLVATNEDDFTEHTDVQEITQAEYEQERDEVLASMPKPINPEDLQNQLNDANATIAEQNERLDIQDSAMMETIVLLSMEQMRNESNEQAIMEITTILAGGM